MRKSRRLSIILMLVCVSLVAALFFFFLYHVDNKYTFDGPQAREGVLEIDTQTLDKHPIIMLVDGWAYYKDVLLTPQEIQANEILPDEYIYIGYYGGFEDDSSDSSPHGSATYSLNIDVLGIAGEYDVSDDTDAPGEPHAYTLELPEIFSSYKAYINGNLVAQKGNPEPNNYEPETLNSSISFEASGDIEIVIAVSDHSHFYSGFVYPPAFGEPEAVSKMLDARFLFRAIMCIIALTIGALSTLIAVLRKTGVTALLYGLLCLFFVGYVSYPITKTFFAGYYPFYLIENFSFCAMLVIVMLTARHVCGLGDKKSLIGPLFGVLVALVTIVLHLTLSAGNVAVIHSYSNLITVYEWMTAIYLTVMATYWVFKGNTRLQPLLVGIVVFDAALIMDRVLPQYEPVISGWFPELASFVLVLSIGTIIAREVADQYTKMVVLQEREQNMGHLLQMQRTYYPLMQEKVDEAKKARHDLRHHFVMISGLAEKGKYDELQKYLSDYQHVPLTTKQIRYSKNEIIDILANYYNYRADEQGINLTLKLDVDNDLKIKDDDLSALFSNLLENAMEAVTRHAENQDTIGGSRLESGCEKTISVVARSKASILVIYMENSSDPVTRTGLGFLSSKEEGRIGYGLDSIKTIAERYNGSAEFHYDPTKKVFVSNVTLES